jgi:peroxiredoxin
MAVEVGQTAPEFSLYDQDRNERSLGEFKGKKVILAFFPGAFTGVCTTEMCTLRDRADQFNSLNAQVLGISVDPPFAQKAWADANNLNFPVLCDFNRQVVNQYDVALPNLAGLQGYTVANRAVFVVDKEGVVRYKWLAPSPVNEPDYEEIQQALTQLPN